MRIPDPGAALTATDKRLIDLVRLSLLQWGIRARISCPDSVRLLVTDAAVHCCVQRADAGLPFRWIVTIDQRRRTANSVTGVLRHLRLAFDVDYQPSRLLFVKPAPNNSGKAVDLNASGQTTRSVTGQGQVGEP